MVWGFVASFCSAVVSAVSSIGPAVSTFCTSVLPKIVPALETIGSVIKGVANAVLRILDIFQPDEDVEEMGDRAIQAGDAGIKPEKFDTFDEYMEEIRNFKLDPEKSAQMSGVEKIAAGLAIGATGLENKFDAPEGSMGPLWLLAASNPTYFTADRLISLVKSGSDIGQVAKFFEGKLGPSDAVATQKTLMGLERELSPGKSDDAIYADLDAASDAVRKLDK
jgi:hypothetical protein